MSTLPAVLDALTTAYTVLVPLGDPVPEADEVKPGWIALGVVVLLFVVTFLLWMSMRKQIGKIQFEEKPDPAQTDAPRDQRDEPAP